MSGLKTYFLIAALAMPASALAAPEDPGRAPATEEAGEVEAQLYDALAAATSESEARAIETRIFAYWAHTESPSEALIFEQATVLLGHGELVPAREKLDALTEVAPDYVEGWAFRALINRELGHYDLAIADLERVLAIEPKHFRALGLLGSIFEELDDPKSALKAFEAAVEINPLMEGGAENVRRLTDEVKGRGI